MTVAEQFAANLVAARKHAGLTQEDVSFRADLHRTEVSQLERGLRLPRIDTLGKVAAALRVPPAALLEGIEWEAREAIYGRFRAGDEADPSATLTRWPPFSSTSR